MKRQNHEEMIFGLLHNNLSPQEAEDLISDLEKSGMSREEIDSIRFIDKLMDHNPSPEPTERMDRRFYAMIREEQKKALSGEPDKPLHNQFRNFLTGPGFRIAAGISLFLLGWFTSGWFGPDSGGNGQLANLTGEVKQLKETLVLTMMQQSSTVERIKAVNMAGQFDSADNQVIAGLIDLLNNDSNDNVRLLALDALIRYSSLPEVRDGLIASIDKQSSPMVQLRLAEIMLSLNEKRAVPEFQKVLQNSSLNYRVRGKVNEALVVLL